MAAAELEQVEQGPSRHLDDAGGIVPRVDVHQVEAGHVGAVDGSAHTAAVDDGDIYYMN